MPPAKKRGRPKKSKPKKKILLHKLHKSPDQKSISHLFPHLISAASASLTFLRRHDLHLSPSQATTLESLLSSTSLSLTTLMSRLSLPPPPPPHPLPPLPPPHSWFHRFLSASQTHQDSIFPQWVHFFNLSSPSFTLLLHLLTPSLSSLSPIRPDYALAATLYRLAHAVSFSAVGRRFEMDATMACRAFYTVVKAINDHLGHLFEFQEDISRVVVGFGWISLPNCCGVLGFERFGVDGEVLGENGSLLVQGLVDSEGRFLDVSAGWPSTLTADSILRKSMLFSGVEESKDYLNGSSYKLSDGHSIPQYILGESSFPLLPWLLTPYKSSNENEGLSETEMVFNSVHSKGIELVKKAFGKVKLRWKLVAKNSKEQCIEAFPDVIVACCLLHNFLIKSGDEGKLVEENVEFSGEQFFPAFEGDGENDGVKIRDVLALHLCRAAMRSIEVSLLITTGPEASSV